MTFMLMDFASRQVIKGYKGFPEYGSFVSMRRSDALGKNVYQGHQRYLSTNHPYYRMKRALMGIRKCTWLHGVSPDKAFSVLRKTERLWKRMHLEIKEEGRTIKCIGPK